MDGNKNRAERMRSFSWSWNVMQFYWRWIKLNGLYSAFGTFWKKNWKVCCETKSFSDTSQTSLSVTLYFFISSNVQLECLLSFEVAISQSKLFDLQIYWYANLCLTVTFHLIFTSRKTVKFAYNSGNIRWWNCFNKINFW